MQNILLTILFLFSSGIALADSISSSGARTIENPVTNGTITVKVKPSGTPTTALNIGASGSVTAPVSLSTPTLSLTTTPLAISSGGTNATTQATALSNILGSSAVPIANGGTNATTQATALSNILGSSAVPIANGGTAATTQATALSNILGSSAVPIANGGTGQTTALAGYTALTPITTRGDLVTKGASSIIRLPIGANNTVLRSNGTDLVWGNVALATDVSGTLAIGSGGTGATTAAGARTNLGLGTLATLNSITSSNLASSSGILHTTCTHRTAAGSNAATFTATCSAGEEVTGGGCQPNSGTDTLTGSWPTANGWSCRYATAGSGALAHAICCLN